MYTIYHDFIINSTKNQVFEAFTNPHHLNNWWTLRSSGKPALDEIYNLNFTETYNWYAKVTEVAVYEKFFLSLTTASEDWLSTTFGIVLENAKNGTLVKFSHKGWQTINAEYRNTSFCWAMLLNGLKNYIEKGTIIPFEQRS